MGLGCGEKKEYLTVREPQAVFLATMQEFHDFCEKNYLDYYLIWW